MKHKCRYCGKDHLEGSPLPYEDWPWRKIITLERSWHEKHHRMPRCRICDAPMLCGQRDTHLICARVSSALTDP